MIHIKRPHWGVLLFSALISITNQHKEVIDSRCFLATHSRRMDDGMLAPL
jgi:hypothetical protein